MRSLFPAQRLNLGHSSENANPNHWTTKKFSPAPLFSLILTLGVFWCFFFPLWFVLPIQILMDELNKSLDFFFFWLTMQLVGSQFPHQGLNPRHGSESTESEPWGHPGTPKPELWIKFFWYQVYMCLCFKFNLITTLIFTKYDQISCLVYQVTFLGT